MTAINVITGEFCLCEDDARAIQKADRMSFRNGRIVAIKVGRGRGISKVFDEPRDGGAEREIHVRSSVTDYGKGYLPNATGDDEYECHAFELAGNCSSACGALQSIVRAGDVLTLHWVRSNDCENYKRVGFHADELRVIVDRECGRHTVKRVRVCELLVSYRVGPDDCARMIRLKEYSLKL